MRGSGNLLEDVLSNLGSAFRDLCSSARNSSESMKIGSIRHEIVTEERYESLHGHPRERRSVSPSFSSGRRSTPCSSNDDSPAENLFATVANLASFCVHTSRSMGTSFCNSADKQRIKYIIGLVVAAKSRNSRLSDEELVDQAVKDYEKTSPKGYKFSRQMRLEILNGIPDAMERKAQEEESMSKNYHVDDYLILDSLKIVCRRKNK